MNAGLERRSDETSGYKVPRAGARMTYGIGTAVVPGGRPLTRTDDDRNPALAAGAP